MKRQTNDDVDSIPISCLVYVLLAIGVIVAGAVLAIVRLMQHA